MRRPSGSHLNDSMPGAKSLARSASPPSGAIRYSCGVLSFLPCCSRRATNAMRSPCGDHAGWPSLSPQRVSGRAAARCMPSSHNAVVVLFLSMSGVLSEHTARRPSGASVIPPTRCSCQEGVDVQRRRLARCHGQECRRNTFADKPAQTHASCRSTRPPGTTKTEHCPDSAPKDRHGHQPQHHRAAHAAACAQRRRGRGAPPPWP